SNVTRVIPQIRRIIKQHQIAVDQPRIIPPIMHHPDVLPARDDRPIAPTLRPRPQKNRLRRRLQLIFKNPRPPRFHLRPRQPPRPPCHRAVSHPPLPASTPSILPASDFVSSTPVRALTKSPSPGPNCGPSVSSCFASTFCK